MDQDATTARLDVAQCGRGPARNHKASQRGAVDAQQVTYKRAAGLCCGIEACSSGNVPERPNEH